MRTLGLSLAFVVGCGGAKAPAPGPSNATDPTAAPAAPEATKFPVRGGTGKAEFTITGLSPEKGDQEGGTYVVLKGETFIKNGPRQLKIYFGEAQGTVVRFQSDNEVIVQAPGGKLGEVDVRVVFDPGGEVVLKRAFTFIDKGTGPGVDDLDKKN